MLAIDHVTIAGDSHEDVANRGRFTDRHHTESVHHCFDGLNRIDFRHHDIRAHTTRTQRDSLTAPAVTDNYKCTTSKQNVCRPNNTVECRLARAVTIVEEVFRLRVVDCDGREGQHTCSLHRVQTLNARRRFFSGTDDFLDLSSALFQQCCDYVRTIVNDDVRM